MASKSGYLVRYASYAALKRDHTNTFAVGRARVAHAQRPPLDTELVVRVVAPDSTIFDLDAKVVERSAIDVGMTLASAESCRPRAALDMFLRGDRFRRALEEEKAPGAKPTVEIWGALPAGADDELTDPHQAQPELTPEPVLDEGPSAPEEGAGDGDTAEGRPLEGSLPDGISAPGPGEDYAVYVTKYATVTDFAAARDGFRSTQRLVLPIGDDGSARGKVAELRLVLPGHNIFRMFALVESSSPTKVTVLVDANNQSYRLACLYVDSPSARARIKSEEGTPRAAPEVTRLTERVPEGNADDMPIRRRLQRMGMDDKINLALSGNREERMALAMDGNKAVHHYLLRNAKISLDEIAFMARLPTMNPDVLEKIAENPSYTQNPSVTKALVYNPKTPVQTAIRLLDRLPRPELVNLSKRGNLNLRLVMAAKKKLETKRV